MYIDVGPHSNPHFKITATSQRSLSNFRFSKRSILLESKKKMEILPKRDVNIATRYALLNDFESSTKIEIMNRPFAKPKIGQ